MSFNVLRYRTCLALTLGGRTTHRDKTVGLGSYADLAYIPLQTNISSPRMGYGVPTFLLRVSKLFNIFQVSITSQCQLKSPLVHIHS